MDRQEHTSSIGSKGCSCIDYIKAIFEILHNAYPSFQTGCWKLKKKNHLYAHRYALVVGDITLNA